MNDAIKVVPYAGKAKCRHPGCNQPATRKVTYGTAEYESWAEVCSNDAHKDAAVQKFEDEITLRRQQTA